MIVQMRTSHVEMVCSASVAVTESDIKEYLMTVLYALFHWYILQRSGFTG